MKYYNLALTHLNAVISSGKHQLNPSFEDEWTLINKQTLDTQYQENLFEVPMGLGNSSELGYGIGVRFADNCAYALKGNSSANVQLPSTLFWKYDHSGKDTRRDVTCANFEIKVDNGVTTETMLGNKPFNIYCGKWDVRKFSDDWSAIAKIKNAKFGTGINYVKLRYSQVLLWYAEVMNELNGNPDVATGGCGLTNKVWDSFLDGLGNGFGYAIILVIVAFFRELLGSGTLLGFRVIPESWYIANGGVYENCGMMMMPAMALILVGCIIWAHRGLNKEEKK